MRKEKNVEIEEEDELEVMKDIITTLVEMSKKSDNALYVADVEKVISEKGVAIDEEKKDRLYEELDKVGITMMVEDEEPEDDKILSDVDDEPTEEELEDNRELPKDYSKLGRSIFWIVLGLACLIVGSDLFVDAASYVAHRYGVRQSVVGLTIVAGGTSLPELATSVVAAYKGRSAIAIGNVIGSNVFNILMILGLTAVVHPMRIMGITIVDLTMMLVSIGLLWMFAFTKYYVSRKEGAVLIGGFAVYMGWLFYLL
jgi:Ca2+/Na+ antiporter